MADQRSVRAETPGRRPSPNLVAGALLLLLVATVLLWQRPWETSNTDDVVPVPDDAAAVLLEQFGELSEADTQAAFVAAAGSGSKAQTFASSAWTARAALDVTDAELRYLRGGEVADRADGSTLAEVAVSWRTGRDSAVAGTSVRDATVGFRLDPQADGTFSIRSASAADAPLPLWLAGDVGVQGTSGVRVVTVNGGVPDVDVPELGRAAREQVGQVVGGVDGNVVIISPRTRGIAAALVGRPQSAIASIAAVTTTVDGGVDSPRVIVLNPAQFATMDDRAAQVVMSHEATHQLTEAVGTDVEPWVGEGFADFVALRDDDAPLSLSAGQILREVTDDGPPEKLPSGDDFGRADHGLGAVYESAWMVFRMLGERHSDATIVRFYRDVQSGTAISTAVGRAFDLTVPELTAEWRDYLTKSASTVS